jgi:hypothetical protein
MQHRGLSTILILGFVVAAAAGCSGSKTPAGPSAASTAPPSAGAGAVNGATVSGVVTGSIGAASFRPAGATVAVTIVGTSISSTVDGSGAFVLRGVPAGTVLIRFTGNGTNAQIELDGVTQQDDIHITVNLHGSSADIDDDDSEDGNRVEIEGRITSINTAGRTVHVANKDVSIPNGTSIVHGGTQLTFGDLHVGDRIHAHASLVGGVIVASSVEVQTSNGPGSPEPGDNDNNDQNHAELKGMITGLSGACPSLTFTVNSTKVTTNAATKFEDSACTSLVNGNSVEVEGTRQADSSVLATSVEKQ